MADERKARPAIVIGAWLASVSAHGLAIQALFNQPFVPRPEPAPSAVRIEVVNPPPPPKPEPEPEPEKPEPVTKPSTPAAKPRATSTAQAEVSPPPSEPSGTTLDQNDPSPFEMPSGDGQMHAGPIGPVVHAPAPAPPKPAPPRPAVAPPPASVPLANLSRKPSPPSLDAALERNYPAEARRRGIGGRAVVRARIDRSGRVESVSVKSETDAGFGEACRRTLLGTRWTAPIDRDGQPVATEVSYACRFRVND
jgi:protein TonB